MQKYIFTSMILLALIVNVVNAEQVVDKKGKIIYEITSPTAEKKVDPDTITDANRRQVSFDSAKYAGPTQNVFSKEIIFKESEAMPEEKEYSIIRHTTSITDLSGEKYFLNNDETKDRMRLTIITSDGIIDGKNGYFKIDDKIYYFDEDGLMVLGPCYDTIGNYYFFSYETGELIEEIQKR